MIDNVGLPTTAIVNILHSDWSRLPRVSALYIFLIFCFCNHSIINSLEWTALLWWFKRNVVCNISRECLWQNPKSLSIKFSISVQTHFVSHCGCTVRNLPNRYFDRRFVFCGFISVTSDINILKRIILNEVFVTTLRIWACARNLRRTEPIVISDRLDFISGYLHCIRLIWHFYLNNPIITCSITAL